ncbi:MAG: GldG family protein [Candidatus Hydrogenedentes bacterium]|nr:GldG family protein [Candidatus Hydrogenedentota bacterium]
MMRVRKIAGYMAAIALAAAVNLVLLKEDPFVLPVVAALGVGLVSGCVWLVLLAVGVWTGASEKASLSGLNTVVGSALFFGICIVLYAFVSHWDWSVDLTREGRRTLAEQTVSVLKSLDKDVHAACLFTNLGDTEVSTSKEKTRRFLERCQKVTPHLKVEFTDPQRDPALVAALKLEDKVSAQGAVVLVCGSRQRVLSLTGTKPRLEERDFTNALINVVRNSEPKIYSLTGHGERDLLRPDASGGGSKLKALLEAEAYRVEPLAISVSDPKIPADCDVLLINGPNADLHPEEINAVDALAQRGGRLLVLSDPQLASREGQSVNLYGWLRQRYGIVAGQDTVVSRLTQSSLEVPLLPDSSVMGLFSDDPDPAKAFQGCYEKNHPITRGFAEQMVLPAARTVTFLEELPSNVAGTTLLRTLPQTFAETDLRGLYEHRTVHRDPDEPEGSLGVAVTATAKTDVPVGDSSLTRDTRLVVVGDSDFASNGRIDIAGHVNFVLNTVAWLTENEELIAIRPTGVEDPPILLTDAQEQAVAWIASLGVLQAVVVAGWFAYRRRRKYR